MKPFKTSWGFLLSVPALFLITSCSKNMNEQQNKSANDAEQLAVIATPVCTYSIGMQMRDNAGGSYFWVGNTRTNVNKQTSFSGMDFSDNQLIRVTALGPVGAVPNHSVSGEHLGVKSSLDDVSKSADPTRINAGETLVFTLGTKMTGYVMRSIKLQLQATTENPGRIEFWDGTSKIDEVPLSGLTPSKNSGFEYTVPFNRVFNSFRIVCTNNTVRVNARNTNPGPEFLPPTEFIVSQNSGASVNTNMVAGAPFIRAYSGGRNNYVGDVQPNNGVLGISGGLEFLSLPKEYLKIYANGDNKLVFTPSGARLSVLDVSGLADVKSISTAEEMIIEPGNDFGSDYFGGAEIRVANDGDFGDPLRVELYDGATMIGSFMTNGQDAAYNLFYPKEPFNMMKIIGTGTGSTLGRAGIVLRMVRGCK